MSYNMSYYQRHLPHWHPEGASLFITWRLHGSLPKLPVTDQMSAGQSFRAWDTQLDRASSGPVWLKDPRMAQIVVNTLHKGEKEKILYRLRAWVIMSNHVHILIHPLAPAAKITQWIKGATAREANRLLAREGAPFWEHESYDRWVRNEDEGQRIVRYIEFNPVAAGLVVRAEQWHWSSAYPGQAEACPTAPAAPAPTFSTRLPPPAS